jgi:transcriptional regulator of aromatic amino acid metabolism
MRDLQSIKQRFGIIGGFIGLNRAIDIALQVAPTDLSVLITGESGTGKEVFPQVIHNYSTRMDSILPLTAELFLKARSIQNFLAMKRVHLQELPIAVRDILKWPTAARSSSTKLPNFRFRPR